MQDYMLKQDQRRLLHVYCRYFTQKAAWEKKEGKLSDEESDAESVGDDEFDDYLGKIDG